MADPNEVSPPPPKATTNIMTGINKDSRKAVVNSDKKQRVQEASEEIHSAKQASNAPVGAVVFKAPTKVFNCRMPTREKINFFGGRYIATKPEEIEHLMTFVERGYLEVESDNTEDN